MLLTIDIGNTNITFGIFDNNSLLSDFRLPTDRFLSQEEYEIVLKLLLKEYAIDGCIVASVVDDINTKIKVSIDKIFNIDTIFVTNNLNLGIKIIAENPNEIGADRIANAVAASKFEGCVIVVDFGTATTFDIVNSNKEFCGGIIAPGLKTQLRSLYSSTSKLPEIDIANSPKALGNNTQNAILSGVIRGSACMVNGLIEQCEKELCQNAKIIATGGFCELISNYMKRKFDIINPILTLEGLKEIYKLNSRINV